MVTETEGTFQIGDISLYTKTWLPDGEPKAKLIFVHGFSDHLGRYYGFFPSLARRGIAVYGFDQRGWGRSTKAKSERGLTGPTSRVIADMAAFIEPHLPSAAGDPPVFVMGHSMGGGQVLTLMCDPAYGKSAAAGGGDGAAGLGLTSRVRGWLLEAPFVGFPPEEAPSSLKIFAGRLVGRMLPNRQLKNELPPENLCRVPEVVKSLRDDELVHNLGTLEGLANLLDRTAALGSGTVKAGSNVRALWMGHGTADKGTCYKASKKWFDECTGEVKDKTFRTYEGWYHQLHAEPEKEVFYDEVADWILTRAAPEAAEAKL